MLCVGVIFRYSQGASEFPPMIAFPFHGPNFNQQKQLACQISFCALMDRILYFSPFAALIKSIGLRTDGRIDDRSFWINYVSSLSTPLAIPLVYPRMLAIHDLGSKVNTE